MTTEQNEADDALLEPCPECGAGDAPHDPHCLTGQLEDVENASRRLRRIVADGSRPPFTEIAHLLARRMRSALLVLDTTLAADASIGRAS